MPLASSLIADRAPGSDWPHDLSDRSQGPGGVQGGPIRQPFPDVCMCLSVSAAAPVAFSFRVLKRSAQMVWYMIDAGSESGGTWCVPGAHRDTRNPRGPRDGITVTAPIPGELQVEAPQRRGMKLD